MKSIPGQSGAGASRPGVGGEALESDGDSELCIRDPVHLTPGAPKVRLTPEGRKTNQRLKNTKAAFSSAGCSFKNAA